MADEFRNMDHAFVLRRLRRKGQGDGVGFGLPEILPLLTPALYIALDQALRKVVDLGVEGGVRSLAKRLRRRKAEAPDVPGLTEQQVTAICGEVRRAIEQEGIASGRAALAVEALTKALPRESATSSDDTERDAGDVVDH